MLAVKSIKLIFLQNGLARQMNYYSQVSGDKADKFVDTGLTATPAVFVKTTMTAEWPGKTYLI